MEDKIEFSSQAFSKMIMHAMKYPHSVCSGLLLSPKDNEDGDDGDDSSSLTRIVEAIPISHASNYLTPNLEVAFNSVGVFAQEQELVISGYYLTDSYNETTCPSTFSQRITEKILETFPKAVLCFVSIDGNPARSLLNPHQFLDGKWRRKPSHTIKIENDPEMITENVLYSKEKLYRKIVDFDDHFNNISLDWTNATISQRIDYLITNLC